MGVSFTTKDPPKDGFSLWRGLDLNQRPPGYEPQAASSILNWLENE